MIISAAFANKKYAVLGLARSGMAVVQALLASGAEVLAWDSREDARAAAPDGISVSDILQADLTGYAAIIVSPGVPVNSHPVKQIAAKYGVTIIGDIELFAMARSDLPAHKVIGITGTNGKSTTTALVHHILQTAGINSLMGGNIGLPIMGQAPLQPNDNGPAVYVLELSSYQIDLTQSLDCDVAALLNITPDHLDRYENDFALYAAAKERLFAMQQMGVAVFSTDDTQAQRIAQSLKSGTSGTGAGTKPGNVKTGNDFGLLQSEWPNLQGPHNLENARIAGAICHELGLSVDQISNGLRSFGGLSHRMEVIAQHEGVTFVNDSKATNPASTAPALAAYNNIHWIAGGLPKTDTLDDCAPYFGNVKTVYLIGEAGPVFGELLSPFLNVVRSEMLCSAVETAFHNAQSGDVILLSPACASFDQFRDFEARGDAFVAVVRKIMSEQNKGEVHA